MNNELQEHIAFHKKQLPCLSEGIWLWNDSPTFINEMCWSYLPVSVKNDELRLQGRVSIRCTGVRYIFSVFVSSDYAEYPKFSEVRKLDVDRGISNSELTGEFVRCKTKIIADNLDKWRAAKQKWEQKILGIN